MKKRVIEYRHGIGSWTRMESSTSMDGVFVHGMAIPIDEYVFRIVEVDEPTYKVGDRLVPRGAGDGVDRKVVGHHRGRTFDGEEFDAYVIEKHHISSGEINFATLGEPYLESNYRLSN